MTPDDLAPALAWFAQESAQRQESAPFDMLLLYDDKLLWPRPHTAAAHGGLPPHERHTIARHVLARLVGLAAARDKAAISFRIEQTADDAAHRRDAPSMADWLPSSPSWWGAWWWRGDAGGTAPRRAAPPPDAPADRATPPPLPPPAPQDAAWTTPPRGAPSVRDGTSSAAPSTPRPLSTVDAAETAAPFSAFHERLQAALGVDAHDAPASPTAPRDDAMRQLQVITRAYASEKRAAPTQRTRRDDRRDDARDDAPATWYTSFLGATPSSDKHDYALDGWGDETPAPWQTARWHVGAREDVPLTEAAPPGRVLDAVYTTRGMLTVVLMWREHATCAEDRDAWRPLAWTLLRRVQRVLNDVRRRAATPADAPRYLHLDTPSELVLNELRRPGDAALPGSVEAQLLTAHHWMRRHGATETLTRADHVPASVVSRAPRAHAAPTFLVLPGAEQRHAGLAECDHQMRRLAAQHAEWAL